MRGSSRKTTDYRECGVMVDSMGEGKDLRFVSTNLTIRIASYPALNEARSRLRGLRRELANCAVIPQLCVASAEEDLHLADRRIEQLIRHNNEEVESRVSSLRPVLPDDMKERLETR